MPTNPNMVAIQTVTVGAGGAAQIEFTSIPQTYTDLLIVLSGRTSNAAAADDFYVSFNSTTTNYSNRTLSGNGSTASSGNSTAWAGIYGVTNGANATASTFSNAQIYVPNYTSSNNKSVSIESVSENNATTAFAYMTAGLWSNSAAITSVKIKPDNNFAQYSTATLYGVTSADYGAKATGGIITSDANYYYHTFLASGTFTPTQNLTCDYLVVAGGGGGAAAGGGGGGMRCTVTATGGGGSLESALSLTASTNYTVTIGAGGAAGGGSTTAPNGSNSVFSSITSTGGGGSGENTAPGGNGGSGGGGGNGSPYTAGTGTANQGYAGGSGNSGSGGGGGGAGAVGSNSAANVGGNGGNGVATSISGSSVTYAGGGGGGGVNSGGTGGTGGGGNGSAYATAGVAGTANTGGGGGRNKEGGSGIVIVRYAK